MSQMISGGVCAALGFRAAGLHVGVKSHKADKKDLALLASDVPCKAAAMFTKNVVKAAPIHVTMDNLAKGNVRAIIANSGNANACAPQGEENAEKMCAAAAKAIGCQPEDVLVASTGVIGQTLNVKVIEDGVPELAGLLARAGVNRITDPGHMSDTFPGEAHDGEYPLRRYVRVVDIENALE